jgi:hypothetical protein
MQMLIESLHLRYKAPIRPGGGRSRGGFVLLSVLIALLATNLSAVPVSASDGEKDTSDLSAAWEAAGAAAPQGGELYEIESADIPLAALPSMRTWALANLLIALICLIASVFTIASLPASRRRARKAAFDEYGDYRDFIAKDTLVFKLLGVGVGAASAVLFLLTENLHGTMQAANGYTWLMALILLAQSGILFVAFSGGKRLYGFEASMGVRS